MNSLASLLAMLRSALTPGVLDQPAESKGGTAISTHFHRDLVGGSTDTAAANLYKRSDVFDGFLEHLDTTLTRTFFYHVKRTINDALRDTLLTTKHHRINKSRYEQVSVDGIWIDSLLFGLSSTHSAGLLLSSTTPNSVGTCSR